VENAIKIARRAGIPGVEFIGEIGDHDKGEFSVGRWRCCSLSTGRSLRVGHDRSNGQWHPDHRV